MTTGLDAPVRPYPASLPAPRLARGPKLTWEEYIARERESVIKHHFDDGRLINFYGEEDKVAGASLEHNTLNHNLQRLLGNALADTDWRVMGSDMMVKVSGKVAYYPDVVVSDGQPSITWGDALQNPVLIAEVLSDSTAAFDRGPKFQQYRTLPSLRHLLFVEQYRPYVEHWEQDDQGVWKLAGEYNDLDQILTLAIGGRKIAIALSDLYRFIVFPPMRNRWTLSHLRNEDFLAEYLIVKQETPR